MQENPSPESNLSPADRRHFLAHLAGGLAFLALGSEAALGRSLLLRPVRVRQDPAGPKTCPTTRTRSASGTTTFEDDRTGTLTNSFTVPGTLVGTWSETFVLYSDTWSYSGTASSQQGTVTWSYNYWGTQTYSQWPAHTLTKVHSGEGGVETVSLTRSMTPGTVTWFRSATGSWTTTVWCSSPPGGMFVLANEPEPAVESMDLGPDLSDSKTRYDAQLSLVF